MSEPQNNMPSNDHVDVHHVEYRAITACVSGDQSPFGVLAFRFDPRLFHSDNIAMTHDQLVRLRDDITRLLRNKDSWLYTPNDKEHLDNIDFNQTLAEIWNLKGDDDENRASS